MLQVHIAAMAVVFCALSGLAPVSAEKSPPVPKPSPFGGAGRNLEIRSGVDPGVLVKTAKYGKLFLSANEAYLGSTGSLKFVYDRKRQAECAPTHGRFRAFIQNFCEDGSSCDWGVLFATRGKVSVTPVMRIAPSQAGRRLSIFFTPITPDNRRSSTVSASLKTLATEDAFGPQPTVSLNVPAPGFYEISIKSEIAPEPADRNVQIGEVQSLTLSGPAVPGAHSVTIRSPRTGAVHGRLVVPEKTVLAVIETRIATPEQPGQYFPVTTPFGYFGSTWRNTEGRFGGANFSMWSNREASKIGDIPKLSRLLAYRADSVYTTFGHEGIGVKPIGRNPWLDMKPTTRQVLAMRKEPGIPLDTYTAHFLNLDTGEWELFASGRAYNRRKRISYLWTGGFMEVLYPSPHRRRQVDRRGWAMSRDGQWHQIVRLNHGAYRANKSWSYRHYEITRDGWFSMSTGGWFPNNIERGSLELPEKFRLSPDQRPGYLKGEKLRQLRELPVIIRDLSPADIAKERATVRFAIRKGDLTGRAIVYYGEEDKATFCHDMNDRRYAFVAKWKWNQFKTVTNIRQGENRVLLDNLKSGTRYFYRVRVYGAHAQVWNEKTGSFVTAE